MDSYKLTFRFQGTVTFLRTFFFEEKMHLIWQDVQYVYSYTYYMFQDFQHKM